MKTSKIAGAGAAAVGAATAAAVFLLGSTAASADPQVTASASLLRVSGLVSVSPTPYAQSIDGEPAHQELASLGVIPGLDGGIGGRLLTVDAEGHRAQATVAELDILKLVEADLVRTWCDGDSDEGGVDLVDGRVLGTPIKAEQPSATIDVSPLVKIEVNKQTRKNGYLTVEGLKVTVIPSGKPRTAPLSDAEKKAAPALLDLLGGDTSKLPVLSTVGSLLDALHAGSDSLLTVTIGTASCAVVSDEHPDEPAVEEHGDEQAPEEPSAAVPAAHREEAPAPTVVTADLPVTG
ncbi:hypothetical protein [Pseudonocardia xishanensis]|uniref:hypothetical protein n=1 Tax=Pseudonocardia xishanensis TaxID=630995 RepID=UPI0031F00A86